jgi:hypothetical protein
MRTVASPRRARAASLQPWPQLLAAAAAAALVQASRAQPAAASAPLATTGPSPCDQWAQLLGHNAVAAKVEATCTDAAGAPAPASAPPCTAGNPATKGYFLLGHAEEFAACLALAEGLLPEAAVGGGAVPGGRVCKFVTYHHPAIPAPYTKTCYCGVTEEWTAPTHPQVRKTPSWPRSWANFSLFCLYSHRNVWANSHLLGQPNTFLATGGHRLRGLRPLRIRLGCHAGLRTLKSLSAAFDPNVL